MGVLVLRAGLGTGDLEPDCNQVDSVLDRMPLADYWV